MRKSSRILVVDGDEAMRGYLAEVLAAEGYPAVAAADATEALALLERERFEVLLTEVFLPGLSGIELLKRARDQRPAPAAILIARDAPIRTVVAGMRAGAIDCLEKPIDLDRLRLSVSNALEHVHLERENAALKRAVEPEDDIVSSSDAMREVTRLADLVAPTDLTVLVEGESGVGKELVARRLQRKSPRAALPMVALNCATVQTGLLESELFGHEKGSFTGAIAERPGLFEVADGGTLFLDEVGEMSQELQVKLLRVLESGEIRRVGGERTLKVDVRVIAATNRRLADEVRKGSFREDLFYRLNVIRIEVPPLRERREEIPSLVEAFVRRARRRGLAEKSFASDALAALAAYPWPGNVRELENLVERALILVRHDEVRAGDLLSLLRPADSRAESLDDVDLTLAELERRQIIRSLRKHHGNKVRTARKLGINVKTLYNKIKAYEIDLGVLVSR